VGEQITGMVIIDSKKKTMISVSGGHNNRVVSIGKQIFTHLPSQYYREIACPNISSQEIGEK